MKTTGRIAGLMAVGIVLVIAVCLSYAFWQTSNLLVANVQEKAFFLIKTFEAQMGPGFGQEAGATNPIYQQNLSEIQTAIPQVVEINLYRLTDQPSVVASTEEAQIGKLADPEDITAAKNDTSVVLFGNDGKGFIDITAPLHRMGTIDYVIGVKLLVQDDWDALNGLLVQTIALGAAAVILALIVILLVIARMKNTLGGEPEDLVLLVDRVAEGRLVHLKTEPRRPLTGVRKRLEKMASALEETSGQIGMLANGDFRVEVSARSDEDELAHSLQRLARQLSQTLDQIRVAMSRVLAGADQVGQASQALSHSTSDQASHLEEVSASITDLGRQTQSNAEQAMKSKALADRTLAGVEAGNLKMAELVTVIHAMEAASIRIQGVVKTIDDIAFQTNLLALNANVEASRVGAAGRGFAVVAGEVRNLSVRSALAVKETSALVKDCLATIQAGVLLVGQVEAGLMTIGGQAGEVTAMVGDIVVASRDQATALKQIEVALSQMDISTQANAATSEQTASSAQVLTNQAQGVQVLLNQFQLRESV